MAIGKTNNATKPPLEGTDIVDTLAFAVQNGPITGMVVPDTLSAEVVNPRNSSVARQHHHLHGEHRRRHRDRQLQERGRDHPATVRR